MLDNNKTKKQLIEELEQLRQQVVESKNQTVVNSNSNKAEGESLQLAEKSRLQENQLKRIYDSTGIPLFFLKVEPGPQYRFINVNHSFLKSTGISKDQVVGKTTNEIIPKQSQALVHSNYEKAIREKRTFTWEETSQYPTGLKTGIVSIAPVFDEKGNCTHLVGSVQDITERKQAEEALRESEEKFRTYISSAPDAIFVADAQSRYIDVNEAACKMTGYSRSELLAMSIPDLINSKKQPNDLKEFGKLKETGQPSMEISLMRKDGSQFWVALEAVKLSDDSFMAFCSDITETKRLQALESRAERLETAGTIAGQVAHDFNNLLAPMMAYPEFIREELPKNHPALKYIDQIEQAAIKIADINQDLLAMGRRGHYNQDVLNLNSVVQQAVLELGTCPKTLVCETDLCPDLMEILGGESQLHRMISNLLHNAKDAMQDIGQITVKTENYYVDEVSIIYGRVPKGEYVKLTITDTGCGIPDNIVQKIFDPFFTSKATDKKRGSGLGMSVVDAVIKDHHGFIDLSTKVGSGTSFYVYFPITRQTMDKQALAETCGGSETILIVDDDNVQREVSTRLLQKLGYKVSSVESGEKAIEYVTKNRQDLVILDMIMPGGIDGAETYRQILEINAEQRAILLSGFSESDRVLEAQKLGAGAFVKKPVTKKVIAEVVRKELDRQAEVRV